MIENTNTKQFYPGPILNNTLEITDFLFNDAEQIKITHSKLNEEGALIDVDLNYPTDYEVTKVLPSDINAAEAALTASTGQVLLKNVNVLAGEKLTVYRLSQIIQDKDYPRTGAFPAATHEGALDYLTMQNQEQKEEIARSLKVPISTPNFNAAVPVPLPNRILRINQDAAGFEFVPYDLDERLDTFENATEETIAANQAKVEADFNIFKAETNTTLDKNKTDLEGIIEENRQEVLTIQSDYQEEMDIKFKTVADAADKINDLEAAVDTAVAAATTAVESVQNIEETSDQLKEEIIQEAEKQLDNIQKTGFYMRNDNLYFINSKGEEEEFRAGGGLPMFAHIWSDHVYKDASYLRADTYSWHDGRIYKTGYEIIEEQYDNEDSVIEVKDGITYKRTPDGFKIADETQQDAIRSLYETKGIAWIYVIDKANKRFKLPRTKWGFVGIRDGVGNTVEAGLPTHTHTRGTMNITGDFGFSQDNMAVNPTGVFSTSGSATRVVHGGTASGTTASKLSFDASKSWTGETSAPNNIIYGHADTVQSPAAQMYLYFYIGAYKRPETELELGKITEVLNDLGDLKDEALKKNQITNCITEIPQRIKLELKDGVLTLKAGSEVIIPNGFEADGTTLKFDYVTIENDISQTVTSAWATGKHVICYNKTYNAFLCRINHASGTSPSGSYAIYYNTSANIVRDTDITDCEISLPIGFATVENVAFTSINQVFNGIGYIGSTVWVDKGVKCLAPNGRNEDGTLKNNELYVPKLLINTNVSTNTTLHERCLTIWQQSDGSWHLGTFYKVGYHEGDKRNFPSTFAYNITYFYLANDTNEWYSVTASNKDWFLFSEPFVVLATVEFSAQAVIKQLNTNASFRAVNYSDKSFVSGWGMPSGRTLPLTLGASDTTYVAPANGWVYIRRTATASGQFVTLTAQVASKVIATASGQQLQTFVPVRKGDNFVVTYTAPTAGVFRFSYAEGEV